MRPFEPSSTVVRPCTIVEGEFCARTKHRYCMEPPPSLAVLVEQPIYSAGLGLQKNDLMRLLSLSILCVFKKADNNTDHNDAERECGNNR